MKKLFLLSVLFLGCITFQANAQWNPTANLTIFSESGEKFFVYLNGEQYNENPEVNVRIEELPNPYYSCKIMFENQTIAPISKNVLMVSDENGVMQDVTYRIKANNKNVYKLSLYSSMPAKQDVIRPANCAVYQFGTPKQPMIGSNGVIYRESSNMSINMNVPGVQLNVNIPGGTTTESYSYSQTTTHNNSQNHHPNNSHQQNNSNSHSNYNAVNCDRQMANGDFEAARQTITNSSFEETKLSTAKQVVASNCMSADQIVSIINSFSFEDSKLDFAKYAYNYCVDKNNYFKVNNAFSFSSSVTELNNYIQSVK